MLCKTFLFIVLAGGGNPKMTEHDKKTIAFSAKTCQNKYAACLNKLIRVKPMQYRAVCKALKGRLI